MQVPLFEVPPAAPESVSKASITLDVTTKSPGDQIGNDCTVYACRRCGKPALLVGNKWAHEVAIVAGARAPKVLQGCHIVAHNHDDESRNAVTDFLQSKRGRYE